MVRFRLAYSTPSERFLTSFCTHGTGRYPFNSLYGSMLILREKVLSTVRNGSSLLLNSRGDDAIGTDPLPPGQVWAINPGELDDNAGLYRVEVNVGPGSGVKSSMSHRPGPSAKAPGIRRGTSPRAPRTWLGTETREPTNSQYSSASSTRHGADPSSAFPLYSHNVVGF